MFGRYAFILLSVLSLHAAAWAHGPYDVLNDHINSVDGLSNDFVISLALDGQGYVWVATEAGVNRIAGKTCQPFPTTEQVAGQRITALYWHEPSGQMFIGTEKGLTTYDPATGRTRELTAADGLVASSIDHITPVRTTVARGSGGDGSDVWLVYGNGRVQRFDCQRLTATDLTLPQPTPNRCALDDGAGHLYLGHSQNGMTVVNLADGSSRNYMHQPDDDRSLPGNNVRQICQDRQGRLWVGTDYGLALFNPLAGTFSRVGRQSAPHSDNVYDILQTADGLLWVATDIGGIRLLDPDDPALEFKETRVRLSSKNARAVVQDQFGNVWVGNHSTGVDFISARRSEFSLLDYGDEENTRHPIYAITRDTEHGFWMASENELTLWQDGQMAGRWSALSTTRRDYSLPRCLMADRDGRVWIGVDDQGVYRFDRRTARFELLPLKPEGSDVHSFAQDADGRVWIGAEFGVYVCDGQQVVRHEGISQTIKAPATCLIHTQPDRLFIATLGDGIYAYDLRTNTSKHVSTNDGLPSSKVNQVVRRPDGGLWIATDGGLVSLDDPLSLTGITIYGPAEGLADSHVLALQQDAGGRIWVSTYSGISCFVESSGRFYNYNHRDTHQPNGFASGAAITDDDGTIYFGSASGVCRFNPGKLDNREQVSAVQIVTCEAYNPVGHNTVVQRLTPDAQGQVRTTYRQNTLRLAFTVRDYAQMEHVDYSYMMKGMDSKWYDIGNDYDVVFRGLQPGHYTFILRAKLKSQDWKEASSARLDIVIAPPFWQTWWAYLLYALIGALLAFWLARSYKNRLALRNSLELERRESLQKQAMNEERLRFFTNITHELRTPLTLILGPLEDLADDKQLSPQAHRRVSMIQKSAERLRSLITEILEFRKTETQNRRLTVARGDIGRFVREICMNYKELYRNPQVLFSYSIDDDIPPVCFDSEIITTVLNNFLSNAIKYTQEGSITVALKQDGRRIRLSVADTGYGIAADALPHIFERYYQSKGAHQASGTGIGLALVKSLADLHEAELSVDSQEGRGSCFTFTLNADNTYPDALHKEDVAPTLSSEQQEGVKEAVEPSEQLPVLLVIEDNADIREYISDSFSEDFRILQAKDGQEGVELATEHTPDIIVSDIMMPRLNGIQVTRRLKNDIRTSHIPIILLTAKVTDEDKEEGYDSGADSYLTKPFTARLLASRIQNLLTARRRLMESVTRHPVGTEAQPAGIEPEPQLSRLDQEFLDKLNTVIRENIMSQDIDLPFVTDKMAMSHSTFYRKVKALTGMTAVEYIRKFRLQHCYRLLESGDYNVNEAAMMTGFMQMAHFRETFKKEFGILPSEVIKRKNVKH